MGTRVERLRRDRSRTLTAWAAAVTCGLLVGVLTAGAVWRPAPVVAAPEPTPTPSPSETVWPVPVLDADEPAHGVAFSYRCAGGNLEITSRVTNIKGERLGRAGLALTFLEETTTVGVAEATVPPLEVNQETPVSFSPTVPCGAVGRVTVELLFCDPPPPLPQPGKPGT